MRQFIFTVQINVQTAVYTLVNGVITHQRANIKKCDITQHDIAYKCQCTAKQYHLF